MSPQEKEQRKVVQDLAAARLVKNPSLLGKITRVAYITCSVSMAQLPKAESPWLSEA